MGRDSNADPILAACLHHSFLIATLISRVRSWELRWSLLRRASILVFIRLQVPGEIQDSGGVPDGDHNHGSLELSKYAVCLVQSLGGG